METTASYWDPLGENIRKDTFNLHSQKLIQKAEGVKAEAYMIGVVKIERKDGEKIKSKDGAKNLRFSGKVSIIKFTFLFNSFKV